MAANDRQAGLIRTDLGRRFERAITDHRMGRGRPDTEVERTALRIAAAEEERRNGGKQTPKP